jgi:hypothetical protein
LWNASAARSSHIDWRGRHDFEAPYLMEQHFARRIGAGKAAYLSGVSANSWGNHFCPVTRNAIALATVKPFS